MQSRRTSGSKLPARKRLEVWSPHGSAFAASTTATPGAQSRNLSARVKKAGVQSCPTGSTHTTSLPLTAVYVPPAPASVASAVVAKMRCRHWLMMTSVEAGLAVVQGTWLI